MKKKKKKTKVLLSGASCCIKSLKFGFRNRTWHTFMVHFVHAFDK